MKVEPRRSKFKKQTCHYNQDNVLDIIDIEDTLSKNRFIPKAPIENFLYAKLLEANGHSTPFSSHSAITPLEDIDYIGLNKNKFKIDFKSIRLEYPNGYSILLVEVYHIIQIIGEGGFGLVISVINRKTKEKKAIKIIEKTKFGSSDKEVFEREVQLINKLSHPRVLKIFEVLDTAQYFFIFMELIEGGSLRDLIVSRYKDISRDYLFRDSECSVIITGILEGLNYLHKYRIIHRDIKPENIMLKVKDDLTSITLCDFGIACRINNDTIQGKYGTTLYMAPEIIQKRRYDQLIDSWSAGIILYILVSGGEHPLYKRTMSQAEFEETLLKKEPIAFHDHIPLLARNLFLKLCKFEPFYRYEPYKALKHPWITRCNRSQIPMTLVEEYQKEGKIKEFKSMLSAALFFNMFKSIYHLQLAQPKAIEEQPSIKDAKEEKGHFKLISSVHLRRTRVVRLNATNKDALSNNSKSILIAKQKTNSSLGLSNLSHNNSKVESSPLQSKRTFLSRNSKADLPPNQSYSKHISNKTSSNFILHVNQGSILSLSNTSNKKQKIYLKTNKHTSSRLVNAKDINEFSSK